MISADRWSKKLKDMDPAERKKWQFCPIMCTGNATRQQFNASQVKEFGKAKNLPILQYYDKLSNITDPHKLEKLSRLLKLKNPITQNRTSRVYLAVMFRPQGSSRCSILPEALLCTQRPGYTNEERAVYCVCFWSLSSNMYTI